MQDEDVEAREAKSGFRSVNLYCLSEHTSIGYIKRCRPQILSHSSHTEHIQAVLCESPSLIETDYIKLACNVHPAGILVNKYDSRWRAAQTFAG